MSQLARSLPTVNNDIYERLGSRWYDAADDPVALLRAEAKRRLGIQETATRLGSAGADPPPK